MFKCQEVAPISVSGFKFVIRIFSDLSASWAPWWPYLKSIENLLKIFHSDSVDPSSNRFHPANEAQCTPRKPMKAWADIFGRKRRNVWLFGLGGHPKDARFFLPGLFQLKDCW